MSLLPSLLLYNPLEALLLIYAIFVISKQSLKYNFKFSFKLIAMCYVISTVNLIIQYIPYLPVFANTSLELIMHNVVALFLMPIVLSVFCKIKYRTSFMVCLYNLFTLITYQGLYKKFIYNFIMGNLTANPINELCLNLSVKLFQFSILVIVLLVKRYIYKKGREKHEEVNLKND